MSIETGPTNEFGIESVKELLVLLGQTDVTEIVIEHQETKIHIKRSGLPAPHAGSTTVPPVLSASHLAPLGSAHPHHTPLPNNHGTPAADSSDISNGFTITAPMVGTFYSAPSPNDPPFIEEGDEVQSGDTVGIIEAMKIMNEIDSEVSGRVVRILAKNGQPVEYGQSLIIIEPL
jgi:acetyl-CoA carboxylase biotin carboxyl carrier protein